MRSSLWSLAAVVAASKVSCLVLGNENQYLIGPGQKVTVGTDSEARPDASRFGCEISRPMDPSHDGLPSSRDLFSGKDMIDTLVGRHQSLVRIPSVCYDDMGDVGEDERWDAFNEIPEHIKKTYPNV